MQEAVERMQRNRFIDVLKGIVIIFVIVLHFPFDAPERQKYLFPFCLEMAVPFASFVA